MSGHSKWSTIKRKKGAADAKRGVIFTRLSKDITLAARESGGDLSMNPALRLCVKKAKAANMPAANIDRAIKKGTGDLPGIKYEDCVYEAYGPSSTAILIQVLTDNKNRTLPEIRSILTKNGGSLGSSGCVNWMFSKKGNLIINKQNITEEELLELLEPFEIEDLNLEEDNYEVTLSSETFLKISSVLENKNIEFDGEVNLVSENLVSVSQQESEKIIKLLELIEEHDDVQRVHTNFEIKS
tara:strand:+ start:4298 stop:5020 length:723 start_codon:yes stop_codon:yes gene_type:complete